MLKDLSFEEWIDDDEDEEADNNDQDEDIDSRGGVWCEDELRRLHRVSLWVARADRDLNWCRQRVGELQRLRVEYIGADGGEDELLR